MTPKQNEPTDFVISVLEHYRQELFAAGLGHDEVKKALTLAKLQSEALPLLQRIVDQRLYTQQAMYALIINVQKEAKALLRAIDEAQK